MPGEVAEFELQGGQLEAEVELQGGQLEAEVQLQGGGLEYDPLLEVVVWSEVQW